MSVVDFNLECDLRDGMVIDFDDQGEPWRLFAADYPLEGRTYSIYFFARDGAHASKVLDVIRAEATVQGPIFEVDE